MVVKSHSWSCIATIPPFHQYQISLYLSDIMANGQLLSPGQATLTDMIFKSQEKLDTETQICNPSTQRLRQKDDCEFWVSLCYILR